MRFGEREILAVVALRQCFLCSTVLAWTAFLSHRVSQLRIVRRGISPLLGRRVIVRRKTSLAALHAIVQSVFAWSDEHRHGSRMHGEVYGSTCLSGLSLDTDPGREITCLSRDTTTAAALGYSLHDPRMAISGDEVGGGCVVRRDRFQDLTTPLHRLLEFHYLSVVL
jgi:hypothetical protein